MRTRRVAKRDPLIGGEREAKFMRASMPPVENHAGTELPAVDIRRLEQLLPHVEQRRQRVVDREAR